MKLENANEALDVEIVNHASRELHELGWFPKEKRHHSPATSYQAIRRRQFAGAPAPEPEGPIPVSTPCFTSRERDILELLGCGESDRQIARKLVIPESVVASTIYHAMKRAGASTREGLLAVYLDSEVDAAAPGLLTSGAKKTQEDEGDTATARGRLRLAA